MASNAAIQRDIAAIRRKLASTPPDKQFAVMKRECAEIKDLQRRQIVEDLLLIGWNAAMTQNNPIIARYNVFERLATLLFGAVFLGVLVWVAQVTPNPTAFQYNLYRIVLSVAAAAATAYLPGFLNVQVSKYIKGGGAFGVFLIVYFWNPVQLIVK